MRSIWTRERLTPVIRGVNYGGDSLADDSHDGTFYFVLVTTNNDAIGLFELERGDWQPGDVIAGGEPGLRVVDVVPPEPRKRDGLKVGLLKVEPVALRHPGKTLNEAPEDA